MQLPQITVGVLAWHVALLETMCVCVCVALCRPPLPESMMPLSILRLSIRLPHGKASVSGKQKQSAAAGDMLL